MCEREHPQRGQAGRVSAGSLLHTLPPHPRFSYSCQEGETKELWSSGHHLKSCRAVVFSEDGQSESGVGRQQCGHGEGAADSTVTCAPFSPELVTVSKDKAIHFLDVEQGRLEKRVSKAHG